MTLPELLTHLDQHETVARAATPGPRFLFASAESDHWYIGPCKGQPIATLIQDEVDALHIATFDPPTALAYIAAVRELSADIVECVNVILDDLGYKNIARALDLKAKYLGGPQ